MARYVPDINTSRWVIVAADRSKRPEDTDKEEKKPPIEKEAEEAAAQKADKGSKLEKRNGFMVDPGCPFCFGNEEMTPPEVYRWGRSYPNDTDWIVRVVPNKYPITDIHEVIIHSPGHPKDIIQLPVNHVEVIMEVYRERFRTLSAYGHVLIFNNTGAEAGASLTHPHSQVVVIPRQIQLDALTIEPVDNVVEENEEFTVYCPDFSQWPYEVWIVPNTCLGHGHQSDHRFGDTSDKQISVLADTLKRTLTRLNKQIPDLSYNFFIYPFGCWYLRIIPRNIMTRAGFEHGTGIHVNTVDPADAARELREIEV